MRAPPSAAQNFATARLARPRAARRASRQAARHVRPAHRLEVDEGVGRAVLHGLEGADRHAELHALAGRSAAVISSARVGDADLRGGDRREHARLEPAQLPAPSPGRRAPPSRSARAPRRAPSRRAARRSRSDAGLDRDARRARIDQEQMRRRRRPSLAGTSMAARQRARPARGASRRRARTPSPSARAVVAGVDARRASPASCSAAVSTASPAATARQPALLLGLAPEGGQRERRPARASGARGRARRARPDLLEEHAHLGEAHAHAAVRLGDRDPQQVRLGDLLPQRLVAPAGGALGLLHARGRRLGLEDLASQLADRRLLVAEVEVHFVWPASRAYRACFTGRKNGSLKPSSSSWMNASTAMPMARSSGLQPTTFETMRQPSSRSTRAARIGNS